MNTYRWFIQIYETVDAVAQAMLAEALSNMDGLIVQADQSESVRYVIIECDRQVSALFVYDLVMSVDRDAVLIGTHTGPLTPAPLVAA